MQNSKEAPLAECRTEQGVSNARRLYTCHQYRFCQPGAAPNVEAPGHIQETCSEPWEHCSQRVNKGRLTLLSISVSEIKETFKLVNLKLIVLKEIGMKNSRFLSA